MDECRSECGEIAISIPARLEVEVGDPEPVGIGTPSSRHAWGLSVTATERNLLFHGTRAIVANPDPAIPGTSIAHSQ